MDTVVSGCVGTVEKASLGASAHDIVQHDGNSSLTKEGKGCSHGSLGRVPQLSADNSGIWGVPGVVANRPPVVVETHFHTALVGGVTSNQSNTSAVTNWTKRTEETILNRAVYQDSGIVHMVHAS